MPELSRENIEPYLSTVLGGSVRVLRLALLGEKLQAGYEPPEAPDLLVNGDRETPADAARRVVAALLDKGYLTG